MNRITYSCSATKPYPLEYYEVPDNDTLSVALTTLRALVEAIDIEDKEKAFDEAVTISTIAIRHFYSIEEAFQTQFLQIANRIHEDHNLKKEQRDQLVKIFDRTFCKRKTLPPDWCMVEEPNRSPSPTELRSEALIQFNTSAYRTRCVEEVTALSLSILSNYYPWLIWQKDPRHVSLSSLELLAIKQLKRNIPSSIPQLIFSQPSGFTDQTKRLALCLMSSIGNFIHDYTYAYLDMEKQNPKFDRLSDGKQQEALIKHFRYRLQLRGKSYLPKTMDQVAFAQILNGKFAFLLQTILAQINPSPLMGFLSLFIPTLKIPELIDKFITPDFFCMLIDQFFLSDKITKQEDFGLDPSVPLSTFSPNDSAFIEKSGHIVNKITEDIFKLGKASGIISTVPSLIGNFEEKIGTMIYESLNLAMNQECSLTLFIAIKLFLYNEEGNPYLMDYLSQPSENNRLNREEIRERVRGRLMEMIRPHLPTGVGFLMNNFTSFDEFCSRLSDRLFMLTQRDWILKLLICYIIDGLIDGLTPKDINNGSSSSSSASR